MPPRRPASTDSNAKRQKLMGSDDSANSEALLTAQAVLPNLHNQPAQASQETMLSGHFPPLPPLLEEVFVKLPVKDIVSLSETCKFFRQTVNQSTHFRELREADLLQRTLRLEDDEVTVQLREKMCAKGVSPVTYQPSFQAKINRVHALLKAYEGFFTHNLAEHERYKNTGYSQWPTDFDYETDVAAIEDAATGISHQNNALDILKATVRLLKTRSEMEQGGNMDWKWLDALAMAGDEECPGIGLAQLQSGKKVIDCYSHFSSRTKEDYCPPISLNGSLSDLGASSWLFSRFNHVVVMRKISSSDGRYSRESTRSCDMSIVIQNSLDLIETLTNFIANLQLSEKPSADEINSAGVPQLNHELIFSP